MPEIAAPKSLREAIAFLTRAPDVEFHAMYAARVTSADWVFVSWKNGSLWFESVKRIRGSDRGELCGLRLGPNGAPEAGIDFDKHGFLYKRGCLSVRVNYRGTKCTKLS
jgi:hypothetical protein